jgi:hypothetical protein
MVEFDAGEIFWNKLIAIKVEFDVLSNVTRRLRNWQQNQQPDCKQNSG